MNDMNEDPIEDIAQFLHEKYGDPEAPREPGRYRVVTGGEPHWVEHELTCEDCERRLQSRGMSFGDPLPCSIHPDIPDCLPIHIHWSMDCPALPHRVRRAKQKITWPFERRWQSWRWRRRAEKERSDPEAWAHYWEELAQREDPDR